MEIRLTPEMTLQYLDNNIEHWRKKLQNALERNEILTASCYIDAYQSVRVSLFGLLKPKDEE